MHSLSIKSNSFDLVEELDRQVVLNQSIKKDRNLLQENTGTGKITSFHLS